MAENSSYGFDPSNLDEQGRVNYEAARRYYPGQAIVDLAAMKRNMAHMIEVVNAGKKPGEPRTEVMGVVKADGYGHGLVASALAALAGGATWLGTAQTREALKLRHAGIGPDRAHIIAWMYSGPRAPLDALISNDIDMSVGSVAGVKDVIRAARRAGKPARVHVAIDTGFGRNGFTEAGFDDGLAALRKGVDAGLIQVIGVFSHLAVADAPDVPEFVQSTDDQIASFNRFVDRMTAAGMPPQVRHLANTAATFDRPQIRYELTRPGNGLYGYEADPAMGDYSKFSLEPAMTLQAQLCTVKDVPAGQAISYGRTYKTPEATSMAIVPLGYADGIHRSASGFDEQGAMGVEHLGGPVRVETTQGPRLCRVSGRVCMDQFLIDLHGSAAELGVHEGSTVTLFSAGRGEGFCEPTADDWARAAGTISYEIYTCLRNRIPRLYINARQTLPASDLAKLDPKTILS